MISPPEAFEVEAVSHPVPLERAHGSRRGAVGWSGKFFEKVIFALAIGIGFFTLPATAAPKGESPWTRPFETGAKPETAADKAFYLRADRFLGDVLRDNPVLATQWGFHGYDDRFPDFSPRGISERVRRLQSWKRVLAKIDRRTLTLPAQIDLELCSAATEEMLFSLVELRPHVWDVQMYNETLGSATYYLTIPVADVKIRNERLRALVARVEAVPAFLKQARRNLEDSPVVFVDFVIGSNPGNTEFFKTVSPPLFEADGVDPKLAVRFKAAGARAMAATLDYQLWLEKELRPRAKRSWRLGKELWAKKLRGTLQSAMTPDEVYARAEAGLAAARARMYQIARPIFDRMSTPSERASVDALEGDALVNAVVRRVISAASRKHSTPATLFDDAGKTVGKLAEFIRIRNVITLPPASDNFVIEPTPAYLDGLAVAFFNPAPAFEPDLKKSFWISTVPKTGSGDAAKDEALAESFLREYNDDALQSLVIHEAFPGHYVQLYWAHHSPHATIFKKVFESGTFTEGWAVLIEDLMFDEAGYGSEEPETVLLHLKMNLRIYMNAMIDSRLHSSSLPEEQVDRWALDLLRNQGFQEEAEASRKLRRAKLSSTQLSTYFVGFYELKKIFEEWKRSRGPAFSLHEFTDRMVSYGSVPPRVIKDLMTR